MNYSFSFSLLIQQIATSAQGRCLASSLASYLAKETSWCWNEDMVEAIFYWISEMRAGNLGFIIEVPNIRLPHLEAWSHIKAWSEKITFEIEAPASIRGNTVYTYI